MIKFSIQVFKIILCFQAEKCLTSNVCDVAKRLKILLKMQISDVWRAMFDGFVMALRLMTMMIDDNVVQQTTEYLTTNC